MLASALLVLAAVSLVVTLVVHVAALRVLSRQVPEPRGELPPISVLKPLCGADDGLEENLASFAAQEYGAPVQIVFGAEDPLDPALDVARRVRARFSDKDITIVHCERRFGRNPKVSNLHTLLRNARHEMVLISDSNVRARPGYLRAMAAEMMADPRVGLVCSPVVGAREQTAGATCETLMTASFATATVCAAEALTGHACVIGKSMLMRRSTLERLGGLRLVRNVLAEDYLLGQRFQRAGYRVAISPLPVDTVNERWTLTRFLERHVRWGQLRRRINAQAFFAEPLLNPTPFFVAALLAAGEPATALAALGGIAAKATSDLLVLRKLRGAGLRLRDLPLLPIKDLLALCAWSVATVKRTVCWRGHRFRIGRLTRLLPASPAAAQAHEPVGKAA